jgi:CRP/FNR family transcriptional regulator, anaerobic regulatory protein
MLDKLITWFEKRLALDDIHINAIKTSFTPREIRKGNYFQKAGQIASEGAFVASGLLRTFVLDHDNSEHTIYFAPENWWISDLTSAKENKPSLYFIQALEDTELLAIDLPSFQKLLQEIPGLAASFQEGLQKRSDAKDHRIISSISESAEQRYLNFMNSYPSLVLRVPQHMLASYLGISPETLSRIRKKITGR